MIVTTLIEKDAGWSEAIATISFPADLIQHDVGWAVVEPSQLQRITPGMGSNFNLSH